MSGQRETRRRAVITGAAGGIGRGMARAFGETMDLVLTDIATDQLARFTQSLRDEGYTIAASLPGDLEDDNLLTALMSTAVTNSSLGLLVHTAALSPAMADWRTILSVNLVATEYLLERANPLIGPGTVAIVIGSNSAYLVNGGSHVDALLDRPLEPALLSEIAPHIQRLSDPGRPDDDRSIAYMLSKRAVLRRCESRAAEWTRRGARLVTLSPGLVFTPMGVTEHAQNERVPLFLASVPAGRWATVMDIVSAARFLASDNASFISGCDLRIDGATVSAHLYSPNRALTDTCDEPGPANTIFAGK